TEHLPRPARTAGTARGRRRRELPVTFQGLCPLLLLRGLARGAGSGDQSLLPADVTRVHRVADMPLAGEAESETGLGQILRPEGRPRVRGPPQGVGDLDVVPHAVLSRVATGEEGGTGRAAVRRDGVLTAEGDAASSQGVDMR